MILGQEDYLEKGMAPHCSILAWRIPWTDEPGGLQPLGVQRVGHNWEKLTKERVNDSPKGLTANRTCIPTQKFWLQVQGSFCYITAASVSPQLSPLLSMNFNIFQLSVQLWAGQHEDYIQSSQGTHCTQLSGCQQGSREGILADSHEMDIVSLLHSWGNWAWNDCAFSEVTDGLGQPWEVTQIRSAPNSGHLQI